MRNSYNSLGASLAGMLYLPSSHDIRRGSARDAAYSTSMTVPNIEATAFVLGHADAVHESGLTEQYVEPEAEAAWVEWSGCSQTSEREGGSAETTLLKSLTIR